MARNECYSTALNTWDRINKEEHTCGEVSLLLHIARLMDQLEHHS